MARRQPPALLLLLFLLLHLAQLRATLAIPGRKGDWTAEDASRGLIGTFMGGVRSFDVRENEAQCARLRVDFGPPNGSVADYGLAITSALQTARLLGGGSVRLAAGTYTVRSPIVFPSGTCLVGAGMGATTLEVRDAFTRSYEGRGILRASAVRNVTLANFTVSGVRGTPLATLFYAQEGLHFEIVNFVWVNNVRMRDHPGDGFSFVGAGLRWAYHVTAEGCESLENGRDGFAIAQTYFVSLTRSRAMMVGRHGVSLSSGARGVMLQNDSVADAGECGLWVGRGPGIGSVGPLPPRGVRGMRISVLNAVRAGVCLRNVSDVELTDLEIVNLRDDGAVCYDLRNASFNISRAFCNVTSGVEYAPSIEPPVALPIPQGPGEGCPGGILFKDVCCPEACGLCGGKGCGTRLADGQCCAKVIRASNKTCGAFPPPCKVP